MNELRDGRGDGGGGALMSCMAVGGRGYHRSEERSTAQPLVVILTLLRNYTCDSQT